MKDETIVTLTKMSKGRFALEATSNGRVTMVGVIEIYTYNLVTGVFRSGSTVISGVNTLRML